MLEIDSSRNSVTLAEQLLLRLHDEELHLRTHTAELFAHVDPNYIIPRLVMLEMHKSDRVRSAAHVALIGCLCHPNRTNSVDPFMILVNAIRDAGSVDVTSVKKTIQTPAEVLQLVPKRTKNEREQASKEIAERVYETLLPQYAKHVNVTKCD
jgi:hypothetical protein